MQEMKHGVNRLLGAISCLDDAGIKRLAKLLNYYEPQLREDIAGIQYTTVLNRDEQGVANGD